MKPMQKLNAPNGRHYLQIGIPKDLHELIVKEAKRQNKSKTLLIVEALTRIMDKDSQ